MLKGLPALLFLSWALIGCAPEATKPSADPRKPDMLTHSEHSAWKHHGRCQVEQAPYNQWTGDTWVIFNGPCWVYQDDGTAVFVQGSYSVEERP